MFEHARVTFVRVGHADVAVEFQSINGMRPDFTDKEMDALLRRNARAAAGARPLGDGGSQPATKEAAHLDADELSAFAENALPAAARGAATAHLADCDECRHTVVMLARAAGFAVESEKRADAASTKAPASASSWRGWWGALFAPRVLRFAAPALALSLVGAITFVALRSRQAGSNQIAQQAPAQRADERPSITSDTNPAAQLGEAAPADQSQPAPAGATGTNANAEANDKAAGGPATSATGVKLKEAPVNAEREVASPGAAAPAPLAAGQAEPAATDATAPPPPPKPAQQQPPAETRESSKSLKAEPVRKEEDETANVSNTQQSNVYGLSRKGDAQAPDGSRNQTRGLMNESGGRAASAAPRESGERGAKRSARSRSGEAGRDRADDDAPPAGETRAVGNHRFRRQGGAWVDVNYNSSMPSTGVRRGTDAYRALVADLPEIGRVAEQLSGEVIVVVRGRAYRVR
jgi:hypothetical protein